jgi:hypothetical protein
MQFNQVIPLHLRPQFAEGSALASVRDHRNNSLLWKKSRSEARQQRDVIQALQKISREVGKQRRKPLGGSPIATPPRIIPPFTFYQIQSNTNGVESWRVLQMADGIFGGRSFFNYYAKYVNLLNPEDVNSPEGNYEIRMAIVNDFSIESPLSQPSPLDASYGQTVLADATDTVLFDPNTNQTCGQIVLNNSALDPSVPPSLSASFWLEIIDTAVNGGNPLSGYYARLMGRMWSDFGTSGRPSAAFPTHSNSIIPLCLVSASQADFFVNQIQTGNVVNNYPAFVNGSALGETFYRGDWTTDSLSGQYFYPADLVTNGTITISGHTFKLQFIRKTYGTTTVAPADGTDWIALIT